MGVVRHSVSTPRYMVCLREGELRALQAAMRSLEPLIEQVHEKDTRRRAFERARRKLQIAECFSGAGYSILDEAASSVLDCSEGCQSLFGGSWQELTRGARSLRALLRRAIREEESSTL